MYITARRNSLTRNRSAKTRSYIRYMYWKTAATVYAERIVRRIQRYACVVCFAVRVRVCAVLAVRKLNFQCYALPRHVCIVRIGHLLTAVVLECIRAPYYLNGFSRNVEVERCRVCRKLKIVIHGRCHASVTLDTANYTFSVDGANVNTVEKTYTITAKNITVTWTSKYTEDDGTR